MATYDDFIKLDIRVGRIVAVEDFPEARKPSYKLTIDFGSEIGQKRSSAQLVTHYKKRGVGREISTRCRELSISPDRAVFIRVFDTRRS